MATMQQQELKPAPGPAADDELDETYEEEPRRRTWGAIASVVLALALVFVGYQWNQAAGKSDALATQVQSLRTESETQRLRAEDAQRQAESLQKRLVALSAEKETLADRIAALEKTTQQKAGPQKTVAVREKVPVKAAGTDGARAKATPVATKKSR